MSNERRLVLYKKLRSDCDEHRLVVRTKVDPAEFVKLLWNFYRLVHLHVLHRHVGKSRFQAEFDHQYFRYLVDSMRAYRSMQTEWIPVWGHSRRGEMMNMGFTHMPTASVSYHASVHDDSLRLGTPWMNFPSLRNLYSFPSRNRLSFDEGFESMDDEL